MVLKQGSRQLGLGLALGFGLTVTIAALGQDAIATVLFGVNALDPANVRIRPGPGRPGRHRGDPDARPPRDPAWTR